MPNPIRLAALSVVICTMALPGCVPSDAEIMGELNSSRREAYLEWKASREQGGTAEAKATGPLSIDDAVKLALQYNKSLKAVVLNREVTRGGRIAAWSVITPAITNQTGLYGAHNEDRQRGNLFNYSARLGITQPIFQGELVPAALYTARLNTALTDEDIRLQVQNLIATVATNYYDVLLAMKMVDTFQESLISAEAQYRMVVEKKKQETATEYDVLSAQVDVANYKAKVQSAKNDIDTNRVTMLKNMGVSQDSDITFSDQLEFLPMRPVLERAVELAMGLRPDIRTAELDYRVSQQAIRISRSAFWPSVAASFTQGWTTPSNDSLSLSRNPWDATLSAGYSLGVDNVGDLVQKKAMAKQAQFGILDAQETAQKEIRLYMNSLANAEETVKFLEVNLNAAREALRLVEVGYQAGVKTEVDVTTARKALTDVMGQYYVALSDHTKARLNLQLAMGVLGPCRVTDGTQLPPAVPIANIEEFAATDYVPPTQPVMPEADPKIGMRHKSSREDAWKKAAANAPAPSAGDFTDKQADKGGKAKTAKPAKSTQAAPVRNMPAVADTPPAAAPVPPQAKAPLRPPEMAPAFDPAILPASSQYSSLAIPADQPPPAMAPAPVDPLPPPPPPVIDEPAESPRPMFKVKVREGA